MEIIKKTTEIFICPCCNNVYNSIQDVERHIAWYEKLKYIKENFKPFHWYNIQRKKFYDIEYPKEKVFIKELNFDNYYCSKTIDACTHLKIRALGYFPKDKKTYRFTSEDYHFFIEESWSIEQCYEEFDFLPIISEDEFKHCPQEIIDQYNKSVIKCHETVHKQLECLSKEELVGMLYFDNYFVKTFKAYEGTTDHSGKIDKLDDGFNLAGLFEGLSGKKQEPKQTLIQELYSNE